MTRTRFHAAFVTSCAAASLAALAWLTPSCDLNPHPLPPELGAPFDSPTTPGQGGSPGGGGASGGGGGLGGNYGSTASGDASDMNANNPDRKSTRLNSSHS